MQIMSRAIPTPRNDLLWAAGAFLLLPPLLYLGNPAVALITGASLVLVTNRPVPGEVNTAGRLSLQAAIVLLGLKLDMSELLLLGRQYSLVVTLFVLATGALGLLLGRMLKVDKKSRVLMASGTAICGGTTIASLSPIIAATSTQTGVAMGLVFLLNAVAIFLFPALGAYLGLTQEQFGVWVALAIHDTSSVVATASLYGEEAQAVATTVKLGRTLWLIPLILIAGIASGSSSGRARIPVPAFILLFVCAAILNSTLTLPPLTGAVASTLSRALLVLALYCIGMEIRRSTLQAMSGRVVVHALALWLTVVPLTLFIAIRMAP